jgi:threonylcarbamoyladenosine tRNA methylthiotransferase MtaB
MKTFSIQTLGCKVNQYESDQIATLLRARGLCQVDRGGDLRIINTCSVTMQAASKSRQTIRRAGRGVSLPVLATSSFTAEHPSIPSSGEAGGARPRVVVTGCWATSDRAEALGLPGVDAVFGHHDDVAEALDRFLTSWDAERGTECAESRTPGSEATAAALSPEESKGMDGWILKDGTLAGDDDRGRVNVEPTASNKSHPRAGVNEILIGFSSSSAAAGNGTRSLPLLGARQSGHQRALLKIQDGCDAHCTYCIIPQLRPKLWSKPIEDAVREAQLLVDAGHLEIVLSGIFLGAYGQFTALRRRQQHGSALGDLVTALCTRVRGLRRLRLSSLEPGDLTPHLLAILRSHPQVVPHFHLPLQSGSDALLRRMNRQYGRDDFLRMIDQVNAAFDRPALTTDVIVGFPGETDVEFTHTLDVVDRARFIHVHAFSYSPRAKTAAARWTGDFVRGPVVNERIELIQQRAVEHSLTFREQFVGETVEVMVERETGEVKDLAGYQHGRCERYFDVHFPSDQVLTGKLLPIKIERVSHRRTVGSLDSLNVAPPSRGVAASASERRSPGFL